MEGMRERVEGKSVYSHAPPLPPLPGMRLLPVTTTAPPSPPQLPPDITTDQQKVCASLIVFIVFYYVLVPTVLRWMQVLARLLVCRFVFGHCPSISHLGRTTRGTQSRPTMFCQSRWGGGREISPNRVSLSSLFDSKCLMTRFIDFIYRHEIRPLDLFRPGLSHRINPANTVYFL